MFQCYKYFCNRLDVAKANRKPERPLPKYYNNAAYLHVQKCCTGGEFDLMETQTQLGRTRN